MKSIFVTKSKLSEPHKVANEKSFTNLTPYYLFIGSPSVTDMATSVSCLQVFTATVLNEIQKVTPQKDIKTLHKIQSDVMHFVSHILKQQSSAQSPTDGNHGVPYSHYYTLT